MAAPAGNRFWELRSKHGRDLLFATPELLWESCCEYFEATKKRKWVKKDWVGKDAIEVDRETDAPFTLMGLCLYLGCNRGYFSDFKQTCSKDFSEVIARVEDIIYTQQYEGATVGAYNANIIARALGLTEKSEVKAEVKSDANFDNLSNEDLELLASALEKLNAH
jgi:hypothetical protein